MAFAVLVFHFDKWITGVWQAGTPQGKAGVYAVSAFFVLSGYTLAVVYGSAKVDFSRNAWIAFFRKRFWRIYPLLWLASGLSLLIADSPYPFDTILLNFSGLFGWVNPARDIATGAWSIGCELVFYGFFPLLLWLGVRFRSGLLAAFLLLTSIAFWIAFHWFSTDCIEQQLWWEPYVQVLNHAFFFAGGVTAAFFRKESERLPAGFWGGLSIVAALCLLAWPTPEQAFYLVSGSNRLLFSSLLLTGMTAYFYAQVQWSGILHKVFSWLGAVSYSLYLLHPIVFRGVRAVEHRLNMASGYWEVFLPALFIALIVSHLSYYFLEKPMMRLGLRARA